MRERMTTEDVDTITPQTIINIRPVVAALKEFFGSSQLSQFLDQTNSLASLRTGAGCPRSARAVSRASARRSRCATSIRPTTAACARSRPRRAPNIGLIGSLSTMATVSEFGFIQTPYRVVKAGKVTDEIIYLDAAEEEKLTIAQANEAVDERTGKFVNPTVLCRSPGGQPVEVDPKHVQYMDVNPAQIVSVAAALIPFLEHNDANRALMGSNMQRQAVPLAVTEPPLIGTGLEYRAATDTGDVTIAGNAGTVVDVDAEAIVVETRTGATPTSSKFMRSNQTPAHPRSRRCAWATRSRRATSSRTAARPPRASSRSARTCSSPSCRSRATTSRTRS